MNQHTDQQLRKKMEEADPGELVPGFDLDKGWQQVQRKSKGKFRFLQDSRLRKTLPYAALFLLGFLLAELIRSGARRADERIVATRPPGTTIIKDTLYYAVRAPVAQQSGHRAAITAQQEQRKRDTVMEYKNLNPEVLPRPVVPDPGYALAEPLAVKHYTDIIAAPEQQAEGNYVVQKKKKGFWHSRINRQKSGSPQKEELPLRGLLYALNQ